MFGKFGKNISFIAPVLEHLGGAFLENEKGRVSNNVETNNEVFFHVRPGKHAKSRGTVKFMHHLRHHSF